MDSIVTEKAALREEISEKLKTLTSEEKTRQSSIVHSKLYNHDAYLKSKRVSIYLSMDNEIDTLDILKHLFNNQKHVFIPRYSGKLGRMDMVRINSWEDYESLPVTRWNIKQPSMKDAREDALETGGLDLVIAPGVAFTKDGRRLGHGKGYYDAFLSRAHLPSGHPYTIALAFKEQVLDHVPVSPKDVIINDILFADE